MKITTWIAIGCIAANVEAATGLFEDFELENGVSDGTLDGQNGWSVGEGAGDVQSNIVQSGDQALHIGGGSVSKAMTSNGSELWLHFHARIDEAPQIEPALDPSASPLVFFYVNSNLNLVVLSNGVPVELAVQMPVNVWARFDVYCDFAAGVWNLAMNGNNVASGLSIVSTNSASQVLFSSHTVTGAYLDSLIISDTEQMGEMSDTDADGLPDWWEQKYFDGVTACTATALSGNGGLTYKETYVAALNPFAYDPPLVAWSDRGVEWIPKPGRLHDVEWASCLQSNFSTIATNIAWPADGYVDEAHTNEASGFYRVKIHL